MPLETTLSNNPSAQDATGDIIAYHDRTKHYPERYANGPGCLDWANQTEPFRRFSGAPTFRMPLAGPDETPPATVLFGAAAVNSRFHLQPAQLLQIVAQGSGKDQPQLDEKPGLITANARGGLSADLGLHRAGPFGVFLVFRGFCFGDQGSIYPPGSRNRRKPELMSSSSGCVWQTSKSHEPPPLRFHRPPRVPTRNISALLGRSPYKSSAKLYKPSNRACGLFLTRQATRQLTTVTRSSFRMCGPAPTPEAA